jgi:hypothetical protein
MEGKGDEIDEVDQIQSCSGRGKELGRNHGTGFGYKPVS